MPPVQEDKSRASDTTNIEGQKAHGMGSWDNVMEQSARLHFDPSIPSSSMGNDFEHNALTALGNVLGCKSSLTEEAGDSQSLQSNWQVHCYCMLYLPAASCCFLAYIPALRT